MLLLLSAVYFARHQTGPVQATLYISDDEDAAIAYALTLT